MTLKNLLTCLALAALALPSLAAPAAGDSPATAPAPASAQITKETCRAQAKEKNLKGEERKAFIKECRGTGAVQADKSAKSAKGGQQTRMKTCNAEAKTQQLKGDARKAFMKECLSHKPTA